MNENREKVKIKNSKGQNILAVIHRPKQKTDRLAILCPGFLDTKDYDHLVYLADNLVNHGYTVVRFDPTGTWESEGSISDYNTTQYLKDIESVKDYMLQKEKYNFILLGGHSMGGRMSLLYAPTDSDISMVLDIMSGYKKALGKNDDKWRAEGTQIINRDIPNKVNENKQYNLPFSFLEDSNNYNALDRIKELHIPILLIAGEADVLCPPAVMQTIFDNINEPKKFIIIPKIGHDYRRNLEEIKIVNNTIINNLNL